MIHLLLLYLPCTFCIGFLFIYLMRKDRSLAHRLMTICIAFLAIQFFANAQYFSDYKDELSLVWSMLIKHFTTPLLPFVTLMYLMTLAEEKIKSWQAIFFIAFPILIGASCATIYFLIGIDHICLYLKDLQETGTIPDIYRNDKYFMAYENVCWHIYHSVIWIECLYLIIRGFLYLKRTKCTLADIRNFSVNGTQLQPLQLQTILSICITITLVSRTIFSRWFYFDNPLVSDAVSIVQAIFLLQFFLIGLYTKQKQLTMQFILSPVTGDDTKKPQDGLSKFQQNREDELLQQFKHLMETQKPYLQYSLKVDDLAMMLNTNRQYISHLINTEYQQTFPDFINAMRIACAKEYMIAHPNDSQEDVARHCGFNSAQTFNRRFKMDEGQTPLEWLQKNANA